MFYAIFEKMVCQINLATTLKSSKMNRQLILILILGMVMATQCLVMETPYSKLPPGPWRAVLKLEPEFITPNPDAKPLPEKVGMEYDDVKSGELPFNFEVIYDNDTTFHIVIHNGPERIEVPAADISFGRTRERARDTIRIDFPVYESYITGFFAGNVIEGSWVVTTRENYAIPFEAHHGKDFRFTPLKKAPTTDLSGRWKTTFGLEENDPYPATGEFSQEGNHLSGTFLTETGDYRFLEGTVQGDKAFLSTFDGSHAFLFEAKILKDSLLTGAFYSGKHYRTTWEAERDNLFTLKSPDSLTYLLPGYDKLAFSFKNPEGKVISPDNPEYGGKLKIIQIMGTWCPNCRDETNFLVNYLRENHPEDVAVIALAFEKHRDAGSANKAIRTYKEKFGMPYEMVFAGHADKEAAVKALPMLNEIISYPTMIFMDKNNRVRRIHTGFSGPATSQYESFRKGFIEFMEALRNEELAQK
jgi:thiol-disulfide isomerase/thioredoxin